MHYYYLASLPLIALSSVGSEIDFLGHIVSTLSSGFSSV